MYKHFYILAILLSIASIGTSAIAGIKVKQQTTKNTLSQAEQRRFDYFFYEGIKLKSSGNYDAAYDAFSHCLSIDSTASAALYELSSFYAQMNKPEKSRNMLLKAVENDPTNFTYRVGLASLSRNIGMYGEAVEEYKKLVNDFPDKPELNYYLADALTQQGEIGKAIDACNKLEEAIGMNETLSMQKYKLYTQIHEDNNAFHEIEKLADKFPDESRYRTLLGDLYLEKNDTVKALACYQQAHAADPESPYYIVSMANYYEVTGNKEAAESEIRDALVNEKLDIDSKVGVLSHYIMLQQQTNQDPQKVNSLFQTLLEQHPEDINLKQMYASLLISQNKTEEARFQYQLITEMEPQTESAWQQLLTIAMKDDSIPEMLRICKKCRQLFPTSAEYPFYEAVAYYQQNKYEEALKILLDGVKLVPANNPTLKSDYYGQIGDIYHQLRKSEESFKAYDESLKYNENNVVVLNNYGYFLSLERKDLKRAERMSGKCLSQEPGNSTYLDTYAWILFTEGSYSLAKSYIESAISKDTTSSAALLDHYGDILYMNGEKEKALEQWKKARENGKKSKTLNKKIAQGIYIESKDELE